MKEVSTIFAVLFFGITIQSVSQAAKTDFFAGEWEINLSGTPAGDVKWTTDLVRKDGKLSCELADAADPQNRKE